MPWPLYSTVQYIPLVLFLCLPSSVAGGFALASVGWHKKKNKNGKKKLGIRTGARVRCRGRVESSRVEAEAQ